MERIPAYLDEEVGDQRGEECSNGNVNVLGEDDALRFDDEEVDKLLDIVQQTLKGCLGNGEVLTRPELGGKTLSKSKLSSDFCRSSGTKHDPSQLEDVADDVQVTGGEDEENSGGEGDTGRAGVLPAQEAVEHAVVVCKMLDGLHRLQQKHCHSRVRFWPVAVLCSGICFELARSANSSRVFAPSALACWAMGPTKSVLGLGGQLGVLWCGILLALVRGHERTHVLHLPYR